MSNGSYCGLSPKCYSIFDRDENDLKQAKKGVNNSTPIKHEAYMNALYEGQDLTVKLPRFNFCKKSNQMKLILQMKNALNSNLTKRFVCEDRVSTRPLKKHNEYL